MCTAAVATAWALLVAGCGQGGSPSLVGSTELKDVAFGPDDLVARVEYTNGFTSSAELAIRLPSVSVYGDGRVITEAALPPIFPSPALPQLQVEHVSVADVRRLLDVIIGADVGKRGHHGDLGRPNVPGASSTRFTVLTPEGLRFSEAHALGAGMEPNVELRPEQRAAREKLMTLHDQLADLRSTLGTDAVGQPKPYEPKLLVALVRPWVYPGDASPGDAGPKEIVWPGPALPGESIGPDLGCVIAKDETLVAVLVAARSAKTVTPWTYGGRRWAIMFRPLLPDERAGCADLR